MCCTKIDNQNNNHDAMRNQLKQNPKNSFKVLSLVITRRQIRFSWQKDLTQMHRFFINTQESETMAHHPFSFAQNIRDFILLIIARNELT